MGEVSRRNAPFKAEIGQVNQLHVGLVVEDSQLVRHTGKLKLLSDSRIHQRTGSTGVH